MRIDARKAALAANETANLKKPTRESRGPARRKLTKRLIAALALAICSVAPALAQEESPPPPPPASQQETDSAAPRALKIKGTAAELRGLGVAVVAPGIKPYPNSCDAAGNRKPALTVSGKMLAHFRSRGFTLTSLCLALGSRVRFDPETGGALPRFVITDLPETELTLNFPDCFKNANALSDCDVRFAGWTRYQYEPEEAQSLREGGREVVALLQEHVANTGQTGVLWTIDEPDSDLNTLAGPTYEWVVASPDLANRVGYALQNREAEDPVPEDEVNTETAKTEHSGFFGWLFGSR